MKTKISVLAVIMCFGILFLTAQEKETKEFKVYGNCGMCEKRIEKAALSVDGVLKADWNKETKKIEITFDDTKTDVDRVHLAITKVGHDTDLHNAKSEVYNKLPGCCKYDRAEEKHDSDDGHSH